jgi:hypothetical protein
MKMVEMNWRPTDRQLRQFGLIGMLILPAAGWLWGAGPGTFAILVTVAVVLGALALLQPLALRYPFLFLCLVTLPIGMVLGEVVMLLSYFLVFVPFATVFRLLGRDPLQRSFQRKAASYWQPRQAAADRSRYFRQW